MNEKAADRARRIGPTRRARGQARRKPVAFVSHATRARHRVVVDAQHSLIPSVPDGNSMGLSVALVLAEH